MSNQTDIIAVLVLGRVTNQEVRIQEHTQHTLGVNIRGVVRKEVSDAVYLR